MRGMLLCLSAAAIACKEKEPKEKVIIVQSTGDVVAESVTQPGPEIDLALHEKTAKLLTEKCAGCHNEETNAGEFNYASNLAKLVASSKYVVPGTPESSLLYTRTSREDQSPMPPEQPLSDDERKLIKDWIFSLVDPTGIEEAALAIINQKCVSCHNTQIGLGGFSYIDDVNKMVTSNKYITLDNPESSLIYTSTDPADPAVMPPDAPLSIQERAVLLDWIKLLKQKNTPYFLSDNDFLKLMRDDLQNNVAAGNRRNTRYFTLHHLKTAQASDQRLEAARQALAKVLNSLSFASAIVKPVAIDPDNLIFRVDLAALAFDPAIFDQFSDESSPFSANFATDVGGNNTNQADYRFLRDRTGTDFFALRADWFAITATMPPIYPRLMGLPATVQELDLLLGIDGVNNIANNLVVRSGFKNSGVSDNNRVIERHVSSFGRAYWQSYDFFANQGVQNIFVRPLGPSADIFGVDAPNFVDVVFAHDGGEYIFELPNGLHGYYLSNVAGEYIHKGPLEIVRNKQGPDNFLLSIANGISCMDCHKAGILDKEDQIRPQAMGGQTFETEQLNRIMALYPVKDTFTQLVVGDSERYIAALTQAGVDPSQPDPVKNTVLYYYDDLTLTDVAAELNVSKTEFMGLLNEQPFEDEWSILLVPGGSITRKDFNEFFGLALEILKADDLSYLAPRNGDFFVTTQCIEADKFFMDACTLEIGAGTSTFAIRRPPPPPPPPPP